MESSSKSISQTFFELNNMDLKLNGDMAKTTIESNGNGNGDKHGAVEKRKKWNFAARFIISGIVFSIFFILIYVLFFQQVQDTYRDLINILIGTYVAVLTKTADYWFKDKDDPEHKETETLNKVPE